MGIRRDKSWVNESAQKFLLLDESKRLEIVKKALNYLDSDREKVGLILFYIYGLRPAEALLLKKSCFKILENKLVANIPTVKGGIPREIRLDINETPFLKDVVCYINALQDGESKLFSGWSTPTNFNNRVFKKIKKRSENEIDLTPYVLREFRITYLARLGVGLDTLQSWKGAKDIKSIAPYLVARPVTEVEKAIR